MGGRATEYGSLYRQQCSQWKRARLRSLTPTHLTSLPRTLATGHLMGERVYALCVKECRQWQGGRKRSLSERFERLLHILDNSAEISDRGHLGTRAVLLTPETCKLLKLYDSFLSSPVIVYTKTIFSCRFPFAFCEGGGGEHNLFPPRVSSWHIKGTYREKWSLPNLGCCLFPYLKALCCVSIKT